MLTLLGWIGALCRVDIAEYAYFTCRNKDALETWACCGAGTRLLFDISDFRCRTAYMDNNTKIGRHRHGCICWWSPEKPEAHRTGNHIVVVSGSRGRASHGRPNSHLIAWYMIQINYNTVFKNRKIHRISVTHNEHIAYLTLGIQTSVQLGRIANVPWDVHSRIWTHWPLRDVVIIFI